MASRTLRELLRESVRRRPFIPFEIRLLGGMKIPVNHPDALAWDGPEPGQVAEAVLADGTRLTFVVDAIVEVFFPESRAKAGG